MVLEDLTSGGDFGVLLLVLSAIFLLWLIRYVYDLKKEFEEKNKSVDKKIEELENIALDLEEDLETLYNFLDKKADVDYVENRMDNMLQESEGKTLVELMESSSKKK